MPQIRLGSVLTYDLRRSTVFLFKVAVASTQHQQIVSEQLSVNPSFNVEDFQLGLECNRIQRLVVEPYQLTIAYNAIVNVTPDIDRPIDVKELTAAQMPFEAFTYTNPSRYCESDLLARFAFEECGQMNRGFARVKAISKG